MSTPVLSSFVVSLASCVSSAREPVSLDYLQLEVRVVEVSLLASSAEIPPHLSALCPYAQEPLLILNPHRPCNKS